MPFLYNGVYWGHLVLSIYDVIVSKKLYNGEVKQDFFGWGNKFHLLPFPLWAQKTNLGETHFESILSHGQSSKILLNYTKTVSQGIKNERVL